MSASALLSIYRLPTGYLFQLQLPTPASRPAAVAVTSSLSPIQAQQLQAPIDQVAHLLNELAPRRTANRAIGSRETDPLLALSRLFYNELCPPPLQQALSQLPPDAPLIIATNDHELPWELLHDGRDYLALRANVTRQLLLPEWPRQPQPRSQRPWRALLIGNPTGDLPHASQEIEALAAQIEARPDVAQPDLLLKSRATKAAVLHALASGDFDLVHYSGHAHFDPHQPEQSGLLLAEGEILHAADIERNVGGAPFVFVNGCQSAQIGHSDTFAVAGQLNLAGLAHLGPAVQGVAAAFLRGGARGFVGASWPIADERSSQFALTCYGSALAGEPVALSLRHARAAARQQSPLEPLWAAYRCYGDPTLTLVSSHRPRSRPATVLVARLLDSASRVVNPQGNATIEAREKLISTVTAVITHYGGHMQSVLHDTLIAVFGLPTMQQNDVERALHAAQTLRTTWPQDEAQTEKPVLGLGLAVSSGDLWVGQMVTAASSSPTLMGTVVVEAQRLAAEANAGDLLISEATRRLARRFFALETLPLPEPTRHSAAHRVLALTPDLRLPWQTALHEGRWAGRQPELTRLLDIWHQCQRGRGQLVSVVGEAGLGKSRLLYEFRRALATVPVTWLGAACPAAYIPPPYWLIGELLRTLLGLAPTDDATTIQQKTYQTLLTHWPDLGESRLIEMVESLWEPLGVALAPFSLTSGDPKTRQQALLIVLRRLFSAVSTATPLILVLEDVHWADETSITLLDQLLLGIEQAPVLVLSLFRPETGWQPPWHNRHNSQQVRLAGLAATDSQELLTTLLADGTVASDAAQLILSAVGGNPFFLRELVAALQESGVLQRQEGVWRLVRPLHAGDQPTTVQRVIRARIESLPPPTQNLLATLAVIGNPMSLGLMEAVVADPQTRLSLPASLTQLQARDFIHQPWGTENYYFQHDLLRAVAYESLLGGERRRQHRRVGQALVHLYAGRETEILDLLAHHFYQSVTVPDALGSATVLTPSDPTELERAVVYLAQAGAQANQRYAPRRALDHYARALQLCAHLPAQPAEAVADCYEGQGNAYDLLGDKTQAIAAYQRAVQQLGADPATAPLRRRAADLARRLGRLYGWQDRFVEAHAYMQQGLALLAASTDVADQPVRALLHAHTGSLYFWQKHFALAEQACHAALELLGEQDEGAVTATASNILGAVYDVTGRWPQAVACYQRSRTLWERLGDKHQLAQVTDNLGTLHFYQGALALAEQYYQHNLEFWRAIEAVDSAAYAVLNLGSIRLIQGEWGEARQFIHEGLRAFEQTGIQQLAALAHNNLGLLALAQAHYTEAHDHFQQSIALDHTAENHRGLSEARLALGQLDEALSAAQHSLELAQEAAMPFEQGVTLRVLGRMAQAQANAAQAEEYLQQSRTILQGLGAQYELARTLVQLAVFGQKYATPAAAQQYLAEAITIFMQVGAVVDLEYARRLL